MKIRRAKPLVLTGVSAVVISTLAALPWLTEVDDRAGTVPLAPVAAPSSSGWPAPIASAPSAQPSASSASPSPSPSASTSASTSPKSAARPAVKRDRSNRTRSDDVSGWRLVWSDEFNGGSVDRGKWNLRTNEGRSVDIGCNTNSPENTFQSGGQLTLRALRKTARCSSQTRQYTQSYLDTIGKHSWQYGRFEMRAKSPNVPGASKGLWPAFWLRPDDGGNGEIDVVELPGGDAWYHAATQSIFRDYRPTKQDLRTRLPSGYPADGFHTYVTEWERDEIRWYIDGRLVWTRSPQTTPWFNEVFHKRYNLRLNFQVGGWLGNPDSNTRFPADFVVDYVRVYQR